jgi:hypothetical protein
VQEDREHIVSWRPSCRLSLNRRSTALVAAGPSRWRCAADTS